MKALEAVMSPRAAAVAVAVGVSLAGVPKAGAQQYRTEHDLLGEKQIPADAFYGV